MSPPAVTRVLYTVLIGGYEELNELDVTDPTTHAICFTDDHTLESSTWHIVLVEPAFPSDPVRSSRKIKVLGDPALADYAEWLYVDNTVQLLATPASILDRYLADHDLAIPAHSFRETVADEFDAVRAANLDSYERVTEQLEHYRSDHPASLSAKPLWNGIQARRNTPGVRTWAEIWWSHILRYSRRDQLSVIAALDLAGQDVLRIEIDNHSSTFHTWPVSSGRRVEMRHWDPRSVVAVEEPSSAESVSHPGALDVGADLAIG